MNIEEFINQLDAGQITDFSPFLEKNLLRAFSSTDGQTWHYGT